VTEREPTGMDEAALTAELAAMAGDVSGAEAVLAQLAAAVFPPGGGRLEHMTWGAADGSEAPPVAAASQRANSEARLRAAELRYRTLVEQIPAVTFMAVLGEGENEVYVSPHIETLLGFTQQEWLEDPFLWYRQLHPDDRALWIAEFARGCRTGGPFRAECRFLARDGRIVWVRGEARLVKDERGRPLFLQGIAFDITESKRAEQVLVARAVRSTEERYRDVVEGIGAIFWEADVNTLQFTFVSQQAERILGYPVDRWLADPQFWIASVHPDDRGRVAAQWQTLADGGGGDHELEYRALTQTGNVVWLHNRVRVAHDEDGRPRHLLGFMVDITERKHTEEELAQLLAREQEARAEAETLNAIGRRLAAELDPKALVQAVTDAATTLTGAAFGAFFYNVTGDDGESYMLHALSGAAPEAFANFPAPRNTPLFEPTFRGEGTVRLDDVRADPRYGQSAPYHGTPSGHLPVRSYLAVPVMARAGGVLGGLFFGHPAVGRFTERHERIIEGLAAQAAIAMDNAGLYQAAETARQAAEAANRAKDDFLATLSHELRTPLTAILGWARMLRTREFKPSERLRAMEIIERNAASQAQLIEDLLDVSRIVTGKLQVTMRSIDAIGPIVQGVVDSFRPNAQARQITLRTTIDPLAGPVAGDRDRLQQVVWNLVSNAVKFTPAGGRVDVSCEQLDGWIEIRVRDTGKGIAPEFLPHVFDRFRQADTSTTRVYGGLGLGLSIVRYLIELHGGSVTAESPGEGRGATFRIRLPVAGAASDAESVPTRVGAHASMAEPSSIVGLRVLLVEDDDDTRNMLAIVLEHYGAAVQTAASAAAAMDALEHARPDIVICDIGLPETSGLDLIRMIRALPVERGGGVPALALTAYASVTDRERALAAGFQEHLPKPIDGAALAAAVAQVARPPRAA
jgi:PAS domain S-box-containing protein